MGDISGNVVRAVIINGYGSSVGKMVMALLERAEIFMEMAMEAEAWKQWKHRQCG